MLIKMIFPKNIAKNRDASREKQLVSIIRLTRNADGSLIKDARWIHNSNCFGIYVKSDELFTDTRFERKKPKKHASI